MRAAAGGVAWSSSSLADTSTLQRTGYVFYRALVKYWVKWHRRHPKFHMLLWKGLDHQYLVKLKQLRCCSCQLDPIFYELWCPKLCSSPLCCRLMGFLDSIVVCWSSISVPSAIARGEGPFRTKLSTSSESPTNLADRWESVSCKYITEYKGRLMSQNIHY